MATVADRQYAHEARSRNVPYTVIARRLGVSDTTVRRWTDPGYARWEKEYLANWKEENPEKQAEYDARARAKPRFRCLSCRGGMGSTRGPGICRKCIIEERDFRWSDIQRMWNDEHLNAREIADRLRMTKAALEQHLTRMRREGWELEPRAGRPRHPRVTV